MQLPTEMRAARVMEPAEKLIYKLQTVPLPTIRPTELLIQVKAAGFCHTDVRVPLGVYGGPFPITGSHEPAGIICEIGAEAHKYGDWKIGDRIAAVNTARACGNCPQCKYHDDRYCRKQSMIGICGTDGAFADYCVVDASRAAIVPDDISWEQAAPMSCAGVSIYSAIKRAKLKEGDVIGISGIGALGLLGVQLAKAMGLRVVGIDAREEPITLANSMDLKPDLTINAMMTSVEDAAEKVVSIRPDGWNQGSGCDAVILLNTSDAGLDYACGMTKDHGTLIIVGGPRQPRFSTRDFIMRQLTVIGTQNGTGQELREAIELCVKNGIRSKVTTYSLTEGSLAQMTRDVEGKEWSGKAVVLI